MVYAYTELMDRNPLAIVFETIKNGIGIYFIYTTSDWFKANSLIPNVHLFLVGYFIFASIVTAYFVLKHYKEDK